MPSAVEGRWDRRDGTMRLFEGKAGMHGMIGAAYRYSGRAGHQRARAASKQNREHCGSGDPQADARLPRRSSSPLCAEPRLR